LGLELNFNSTNQEIDWKSLFGVDKKAAP